MKKLIAIGLFIVCLPLAQADWFDDIKASGDATDL